MKTDNNQKLEHVNEGKTTPLPIPKDPDIKKGHTVPLPTPRQDKPNSNPPQKQK